jgi:hypothetical protein
MPDKSAIEKKADKIIDSLIGAHDVPKPKKPKVLDHMSDNAFLEVFGWAGELAKAKAAKRKIRTDIAVAEFKQQKVIEARRKANLRKIAEEKKKHLQELTTIQERISQQVDQAGQLIKPPRHIEL